MDKKVATILPITQNHQKRLFMKLLYKLSPLTDVVCFMQHFNVSSSDVFIHDLLTFVLYIFGYFSAWICALISVTFYG